MWNPPALNATQGGQDGDFATTNPNGAEGVPSYGAYNFGADSLFSPFYSLDFADFPRDDLRGDRGSYRSECVNENNRLCLDLNSLPDPKTDVKNNKSEIMRVSEMPSPEVIMRELFDPADGNNTLAADCSMNTAIPSMDSQKPENLSPPWRESAAGYPIKSHGAEAKNSRIIRSPMTGSFSSSQRSTSGMPLVDSFGAAGNNNGVNVVPLLHNSTQNADGNFLTLGTTIRPNTNFSTREIASKLEDTASSQYNNRIVRQSRNNPWSINSLNGIMSTRDQSGIYGDTSSTMNSDHFPGFQTLQANPQSCFPAQYDNFAFEPTPSSSPFGGPVIPQPERVTPSPMGPQITGPPSLQSQIASMSQQYTGGSSIYASSESYRNYLSDMQRGSSITHAQLGNLIPLVEGGRRTQRGAGVSFPVQPVGNLTSQAEGTSRGVANVGPFPSSVQSVGHFDTFDNVGSYQTHGNSLFLERGGFQVPRYGTVQSAAASPYAPFPTRLGVQPNEPTIRNIRGTPPARFPAQANPVRPSVSSGYLQHCAPAQLPVNYPRVDYLSGSTSCSHNGGHIYHLTGQVVPDARYGVRPQGPPFVSPLYLKRPAATNSPTPRLGQRRKISPQPVINPSAPLQRPILAASHVPIPLSQIPPTPLHVKWDGFEEGVEPTGHKCLLCKRDLSFTAEGQVYQPSMPMPTAVLPCGHTFHDVCLQKITPEDQLKDPPCIPCALGET